MKCAKVHHNQSPFWACSSLNYYEIRMQSGYTSFMYVCGIPWIGNDEQRYWSMLELPVDAGACKERTVNERKNEEKRKRSKRLAYLFVPQGLTASNPCMRMRICNSDKWQQVHAPEGPKGMDGSPFFGWSLATKGGIQRDSMLPLHITCSLGVKKQLVLQILPLHVKARN